MGGFDATSNVQAGYLYDIATSGTHAHAFVSAYTSFDDIHDWTFHVGYIEFMTFPEIVVYVALSLR